LFDVSVPLIVTVPVFNIVPVLPEILMMVGSLDVNVVELVTSVPFKVAVNVTDVFVAILIGDAGFELMVSVEDCPTVSVMVPETVDPSDDTVAA
jgi:hypothetical protein